MKSIDELGHYELLEIPRTATPAEVDRAYHLAQQTYAEGSLALYSVFDARDATSIRERIDEAYRILSDAETREAYDEETASELPIVDTVQVREPVQASIPNAAQVEEGAFDGFDETEDAYDPIDDDDTGDFDGVRLRRARLFRGYEIDDIADVTKVSGSHLRNIEDENFPDLPADVYVRGFVTAYAKTIGLDPTIVVPSYMARVQESRDSNPRGRFLGRR